MVQTYEYCVQLYWLGSRREYSIEQNVINEGAAAPAVRDIDEGDYLSEDSDDGSLHRTTSW
jgi:hypothetical protein